MTRTELVKAFEEKRYEPEFICVFENNPSTGELYQIPTSEIEINDEQEWFLELCLIQKWLRDEEKVIISIRYNEQYKNHESHILGGIYNIYIRNFEHIVTYESALENALIEVIERELI